MDSERTSPARALDDVASAFDELRTHLFGIAYRVLGSVTEAEDVVQDVWLRWQNADRSVVVDPAGFLARITTRLAINVAQSARSRRETYVGPWLPEPVDTSDDPAVGAERAEAVEFAVLLLLEKLTPNERAAYVLREAFDYPYPQIAEILRLSQANVRQIVSRARKRLAAERRERVDAAEHRRLLEAFVAAARLGDVAALETMLTADAASYADGNGARGAARTVVVGAARVAMLVSAVPKFWPGADVTAVEVNGLPGVVFSRDGTDLVLVTAAASGAGIYQLMWIMSPEKLKGFALSRKRFEKKG
ncbi:RNA polymerase sigma factor SigJ [Actinomadura roseirufa]|uniref:RNA polymerase sigma factor SigJ n=1 Tax=Actinomadura roseirufa TaxID=2094049 RepID=UPI0010410D09|nr:RNA polymerase sigma factor SigJ [Actinomadura roseirufa]